ncbi:unnamed protein product [Rangifer tarandus platyrhynchus]|uniref:Uncharacterized protein n=1 Tax=Rangifer tarandus platyrhynchus TaxID=3082113 RepID=A0AC59ZKL2_RANTA
MDRKFGEEDSQTVTGREVPGKRGEGGGTGLLVTAWLGTASSFGHLELEVPFFLNVYLAPSSLLALILIFVVCFHGLTPHAPPRPAPSLRSLPHASPYGPLWSHICVWSVLILTFHCCPALRRPLRDTNTVVKP